MSSDKPAATASDAPCQWCEGKASLLGAGPDRGNPPCEKCGGTGRRRPASDAAKGADDGNGETLVACDAVEAVLHREGAVLRQLAAETAPMVAPRTESAIALLQHAETVLAAARREAETKRALAEAHEAIHGPDGWSEVVQDMRGTYTAELERVQRARYAAENQLAEATASLAECGNGRAAAERRASKAEAQAARESAALVILATSLSKKDRLYTAEQWAAWARGQAVGRESAT